ncbi:LacI family DNA-binding transcriptional regulator [Microbacterium murale]|uniref:LacI family transcriptional regulator n=1 Tax=Microbacterium murale TaxID=1081040 RepID=A0ABQ1S4B2_9MICO|nr:LacI family DNA-binding transcriptional regulator [Microbacterium murale]GGD89084.1 LacI family transcriptional regulator [Microbacterium murale]
MRQVAALARVSLKTVSRVVNGEGNVSPALAARVHQATAALNYSPDFRAGSLKRRGGSTKTIGLLVNSVDNPFSSALHRAIEDETVRHGYTVFAASSDDDANRQETAIRAFIGRRVDGLILMAVPSYSLNYLASEVARGTPVVFVDREPMGLLSDIVMSENRAGADRAARHLFQHGHRHVAYLGGRHELATSIERKRGFVDAMRQIDGVGGTVTIHEDLTSEAEAETLVRRLLESPNEPTALFCARNTISVGAIRALRATGRHHAIALVGFDDLPMADLLDPAITVVAQDVVALGRLAAKRLFERLNGNQDPPARITVPMRLVERGSGEIAPDASTSVA